MIGEAKRNREADDSEAELPPLDQFQSLILLPSEILFQNGREFVRYFDFLAPGP